MRQRLTLKIDSLEGLRVQRPAPHPHSIHAPSQRTRPPTPPILAHPTLTLTLPHQGEKMTQKIKEAEHNRQTAAEGQTAAECECTNMCADVQICVKRVCECANMRACERESEYVSV